MEACLKLNVGRQKSWPKNSQAIKRRADGETLAAISKSYGVSIAMISRL
jgi:hypothetical protein